MKIYPEQLAKTLVQHPLAPAYWLLGNDPLLKEESLITLIEHAKMAGFEERHRFTLDANLDWANVNDVCQGMSLFSSRQVIELNATEKGFSATLTAKLTELMQIWHSDLLFIITGPKLSAAQEKAKWCKSIFQSAKMVICQTPVAQQWQRFVQQRCQKLRLNADAPSLQLLTQWYEGNTLALMQNLQLLQLLYPDGELNLIRLQEALAESSRYTPFQWIDALLEGNGIRSQRILRQLANEETESLILIRTLQKELRLLYRLQEQIQQGHAIHTLFDQERIWSTRQSNYRAALDRLPILKLLELLRDLTQIELSVKTDYSAQIWPELSALCAKVCGHSPLLS